MDEGYHPSILAYIVQQIEIMGRNFVKPPDASLVIRLDLLDTETIREQ